jgi:biopolymer transport protein ExbD
MSIRFQCPHCGAIHGINEQAIGRRVRCRDCQQLMEVVPFAGPPDAEEPPDESQFFQFVEDDAPIVLPDEPLRPVYIPTPAAPPVVAPGRAKATAPGRPGASPTPGPLAQPIATSSHTASPGGVPPASSPPSQTPAPLRSLRTVRRRVPSEPEIDMTPMVDVTFQLLIFFMLTASFTLQKSLPFPPTPSSGASTGGRTLADFQQDASYIVVRIDAYNTFHISASRWDEEIEAPSSAELLLKLRQARQGDGRHPPPNKLLVVAHGDALHDRVVTALDAGADVGIPEIQLVTVEDETSLGASRPK